MIGPNTTEEYGRALVTILDARRSIRVFTDELPPKECIEEIIAAGLLAPYAAQAVGEDLDFRRFFVISKSSPRLKEVAEIARARAGTLSEQLQSQMAASPYLRERAAGFSKRLELFARRGVLGIGTAPYYIVVAERKGVPPVEQQSLAHCLQNMWLMATALGLGFHLVSATAQMADDPDFCEVLGIRPDEFELNGCAIGYPKTIPPRMPRPAANDVTTWIE